jgi:hypothetical protein
LELSRGAAITRPVPAGDPQPVGTWGGGTALNLSTPELKISLWGPPENLTLSINKTDVWDRRTYQEPVLPLQDIIDLFTSDRAPTERFPNYYQSHHAYDSPCPKPVGQVILHVGDFAGVQDPNAATRYRDGSSNVTLQHDQKYGTITYLPMMKRNVIAMRGVFENLENPVSLRLYRHRDTGVYGKAMNAYGSPVPKVRVGYDYAKDENNGPIEPPVSGTDGEIFWIRQTFPGEKTFPDGFEYVMAGIISGAESDIEVRNDERDLGTKPFLRDDQRRHIVEKTDLDNKMPAYDLIRAATGSAATAVIDAADHEKLEFSAFVVIVTSADSSEPMKEARRLLTEATENGFDHLLVENERYYRDLYDRRENGRIYLSGTDKSDAQISEVYRSWTDAHQGMTAPDPTRYEADAKYGYLEQDWAPWHGLPCYDELYFTEFHVRNQSDRLAYYYNLVDMWLPAARLNARETFGLPGAAMLIGYLPPVKPDSFLHTHSTWEFAMEIPGQVVKLLWDRFDYGGDEKFLSEVAYPAMKEVAVFYSRYAKLGDDGRYHVIPTMSAEHWGWTARFEKNRDSASALSMFRWLLKTTAEASEMLDRDADLRSRWLEIAENLAPLPTYESPEGPIFTDVRDVNPIGVNYNWFAGFTPTTLTDEINLDSSSEEKEMMLRTARMVKGWQQAIVPKLLGRAKGLEPEQLLNSRSGRIHLFPAVPDGATVGFRDFQARGGFLVSAQYDRGTIDHVDVAARRNTTCHLMNPWPGSPVRVVQDTDEKEVAITLETANGECIQFTAEAGEDYRIFRQAPGG